MPTFDKRKQELKDRFTLIQGELPFEETSRIIAALDRYGPLRDGILTDVAFAATDLGDDKKESTYASALGRGREVVDVLDRMLDGVSNPSAKALAFRGQATVEEQRFWSTLEPLQLGGVRDLLMTKDHDLEFYTRVLQAKWNAMTEADQAIDALEREATEAMNEMIRRTIEGGVPALDRVNASVAEIVDDLKEKLSYVKALTNETLTDLGVPEKIAKFVTYELGYFLKSKFTPSLDTVTKGYYSALTTWVNDVLLVYMAGTFPAKVYELKSRIPNQGAVIATFTTTRREADEFLRTNGFASAKQVWQAVDAAVDGWVSGLVSDGCKADGQAFADYVMEGMSKRLDHLERNFNELVSENQGRFLGGLRAEVEEALLETRAWEDRESTLLGHGLEARLRTWRQGLLDARLLVENAFGDFSRNLNDLPMEVQSAIQAEMSRLRDEVLRRTSALTDQVAQGIDAAASHASDARLREAVDRRQLQSAIRA